MGVLLMLAACSGGDVQPTATIRSAIGAVVPTIDKTNCSDTTRAQTTVQTFITSYNAGDLNATLATLDLNIRDYLDGPQGFRAGGSNMAAIQSHLSAMFSVHDHLTAGTIKVTVEPASALDDYYVIVDGVTRTDDSRLTKRAPITKGQIILGIHCAKPLISILSIETLG